jgi:hypothetical protein
MLPFHVYVCLSNGISFSGFSPFIFAFRVPSVRAACTSQLWSLNFITLYPSNIRWILQSLIFGSYSCLCHAVGSFLSVFVSAQYLEIFTLTTSSLVNNFHSCTLHLDTIKLLFLSHGCLLLAVLISLCQWHFLFPQKNVSPTCKLLFSS